MPHIAIVIATVVLARRISDLVGEGPSPIVANDESSGGADDDAASIASMSACHVLGITMYVCV